MNEYQFPGTDPSTGQLPDPHLEILKSLSFNLKSSITVAEQEVQRSKAQLDALAYSKGLVDESLKILNSGAMPSINHPVALTTSSSIAMPMCEQFIGTPPGSGRSLFSEQIQTAILSGVAAFVAANPTEIKGGLAPLVVMLTSHKEELLSLEERLSERLSKYSGHLQEILRGALQSYQDSSNKLHFTNTGNGLRELLREFLAVVAPDEVVVNAPWFVKDETSKSGVTRRHRIDFAIFKNLTPDKFPESFAKQADTIAEELLKDISKLSALTHVTEDILEKSDAEAGSLFAELMQRFLLLISAIETATMLVGEDITIEIQSYLDDLFTSDFFDELDILSTHTRPQEASGIEIIRLTFDENWIRFKGSGTVECDLQWGSDGDVERGDGVEGAASFPFSFSGKAPVGNLSQIEINRSSIEIDTSSYYEDEPEEPES